MKNNDLITLLVFLGILIFAAMFAFGNNAWGSTIEGAVYFHATVVGAGLFWIGLNIKKK